MGKLFMPDMEPADRLEALEANADKVEETDYLKPLTPEELDVRREKHTENSIKLSDLEEEKKDAVSGFKAKMEPLQVENKELLFEIKTKQAKVSGRLYHLANHGESMMETYDENGEMISSRRLRPEEKQGRMHLLRKAQ